MGCGSSKGGGGGKGPGLIPEIIEEEIGVEADNDARLLFDAIIVDPIMHNPPEYITGSRMCKLILNKRRKILTRIVGHDAVSINIENVAKLERDILDNVTLKLVTGAMSDLWHLQFSDARQRHAFYQAMLVHNPYGIQGGMKPTTTHLFTAHFRAVLDPDESQLAGIIPQNPDGYVFGITGGVKAQREKWYRMLLKSSAAQNAGENAWLHALADDEQEAGNMIMAWVDPKHQRYAGNMRASAVFDQALGSACMVEFTLGETSFAFYNVKGDAVSGDVPKALGALNPCNNSMGAFQYDHAIVCGDITTIDVGQEDIPFSPGYNIGKKSGFGWRSMARLPRSGCEQKAKGTIEAGSHGIFKMPIMIPIVSEPEDAVAECPFILHFCGFEAEGLPPTGVTAEDETRASPYVYISGDMCSSAQCEPSVGSLSPNFVKKQSSVTQKGEVIDDILCSISIYTYITDLDYLRMQRVSVQVCDITDQSIYGHSLLSLSDLCDAPFGAPVSFTLALNHNGRKGGRLKGKVSLHRVGDPTPSPEKTLVVPKRAAGDMSAFQKIKLMQDASVE